MKKRKLATIALASAMMVTSFAACGNESSGTTASQSTEAGTSAETSAASTEATTAATEATETPATEAPVAATPSVDFEDGKFAFMKVNSEKGGADKSELSVGDFNGSKAVKVTNVEGKNMFIGINVSALLGDKIGDVKTINIDLGTENSDGFASSSGTLYCYTGEDNKEVKAGNWSVYIDTANPKTAKFDVSSAGFIAGKDNYIILSKETDNSKTKPSDLWIDNITFLDASGATITADTAAEFGNPAGFSSAADRANLLGVIKPVDFAGFAVSGGAWSQAGVAFTDEVKAALVPGSMIEVSYKSETGHMWIVMNESAAGWMRVGVGDYDGSGQGYIVADGSKAYIPFEMIAQYCGDDISTWGSQIQCESDGAWEVYGVRVGTAAEFTAANSHVDLGANGIKGDGWAQDGIELTDEMKAALVPGSVIDISYQSDTGEIWIVMPDSEAGWKRVGVGDFDGSGQGYALFDGSHCQISYEMIAEQCGEDVSKWGGRIQFEASSPWTVNSASIGVVK